jgi:hypothetical protein
VVASCDHFGLQKGIRTAEGDERSGVPVSPPRSKENFMSELFNDERLSTADLVNGSRSTAVMPEPDIQEDATSLHSDREPSEQIPVYSVPVDRVQVDDIDDRIGGTPADTHNAQPAAVASEPAQLNQLFPQDELKSFRSHWDAVQTAFVDEPRASVKQADSLVANVVGRIAEQFASEREQLEKQWDRGEDVSTEDLRQAFKRYRAFFDRLLAV